MSKYDEIIKDLPDASQRVLKEVINQIEQVEEELATLSTLPKIRISKTNPTKQEITPAHKAYRDYLNLYMNLMKIILSELHKNNIDDDSDLLNILSQFGDDKYEQR